MKTQRLSEQITRRYWSCYDTDHRHRTQTAAENCIDRYKRRQKSDIATKVKQRRELRPIWAMSWLCGSTLVDLATNSNTTPVTVKKHIRNYIRSICKKENYITYMDFITDVASFMDKHNKKVWLQRIICDLNGCKD